MFLKLGSEHRGHVPIFLRPPVGRLKDSFYPGVRDRRHHERSGGHRRQENQSQGLLRTDLQGERKRRLGGGGVVELFKQHCSSLSQNVIPESNIKKKRIAH